MNTEAKAGSRQCYVRSDYEFRSCSQKRSACFKRSRYLRLTDITPNGCDDTKVVTPYKSIDAVDNVADKKPSND